MATRAPFLKTRFGGYFHRDVPDEDAELTHVGPGTPGGEYLRRFWQPVCFSDELSDLPRRVKILGEELVVFRDLSGAVGLLELHCPHRGTSLEFGLIDARGDTLLLPRVALRRRWDDPRDPWRAGGQHPQGSALSRGLSNP
jgi:hypothetical protein